ncbi:MAG: hypothetical protein M1831_005049 [Alyxoria varia]|nr:MAG: hypothetical protein M1831_005049 [Alyxoria varia]
MASSTRPIPLPEKDALPTSALYYYRRERIFDSWDSTANVDMLPGLARRPIPQSQDTGPTDQTQNNQQQSGQPSQAQRQQTDPSGNRQQRSDNLRNGSHRGFKDPAAVQRAMLNPSRPPSKVRRDLARAGLDPNPAGIQQASSQPQTPGWDAPVPSPREQIYRQAFEQRMRERALANEARQLRKQGADRRGEEGTGDVGMHPIRALVALSEPEEPVGGEWPRPAADGSTRTKKGQEGQRGPTGCLLGRCRFVKAQAMINEIDG